MIRCLAVVLVVAGLCFGQVAVAADVPSYNPAGVSNHDHPPAKPAKSKKKLAKTAKVAPKAAVVVPKTKLDDQQDVAVRSDVEEPASGEIDLSWALDPLVASVDGARSEGSASVEGNLVVAEQGYVTAPYMIIELTGHVVKTVQTTARIDVSIGDMRRTVTWKADDVQAGRFKIELKAPLKAGKLPGYFPVSALAIVTKEGKSGAAMVSLAKITLRIGKVRVAQLQ